MKKRCVFPMSRTAAAVLATATGALCGQAQAQSGVGVDASALIEAVTVEAVRGHQQQFQDFADADGGNREASSEAYFDSVRYVGQLLTDAGYQVSVQLFPYVFFENLSPPTLAQVSPDAVEYPTNGVEGFVTATFSGSGSATATAEGVDLTLPPGTEANASTSGCEADDFASFTAGNIAIIQRGSCTFGSKVANAQDAGAVGVVIFNEGQEGRTETFGITLGGAEFAIPVVSSSFAIGEALAAGNVEVSISVDAVTENRISANVLADTPVGNSERTVVVGGHLDSVPEGPGINDNGSGTAAILEVALQMSELGLLDEESSPVRNRLRFAFWGAEELGLLGSDYYVDTLSERDLEDIMLNLNFDMIGSPNYARFIYDGDGSASEPAGPSGSAFIEWLFRDYFASQGLSTEPTPFSGRSDYGPFIAQGIPAGGLFTGAGGIKTEKQVGLYGGTAGEPYDPCYHEACDTFDNNSDEALGQMSDAIAYAVNVFAVNELYVEPMAKRKAQGAAAVATFDYLGSHLQR